jgi:hypothetical protein
VVWLYRQICLHNKALHKVAEAPHLLAHLHVQQGHRCPHPVEVVLRGRQGHLHQRVAFLHGSLKLALIY